MILSDVEICQLGEAFISPFVPQQVRKLRNKLFSVPDGAVCEDIRAISFGTSSYGYDARLANEFKVFTDLRCSIMDPKNPPDDAFVDMTAPEGQPFVIPPGGYVLGRTVEHFCMPPDVISLCVGKSTYARSGLIVNVTPLEPAWRGYVTLEFMNALPIPTLVYPNEGICQFLFFRGSPCRTNYDDRGGKYQDQVGVVLPRS